MANCKWQPEPLAQETKMAKISAKIPDEIEDGLIERTDYPKTRKSDVIREAFELYLAIENPKEVINESKSK